MSWSIELITRLLSSLESFWKRKKRRAELLTQLRRLPPQTKAQLVKFHEQGTHTLLLRVECREVKLLVKLGILKRIGSNCEVERYHTIVPKFQELMDDWWSTDPIFLNQLR